MKSIKAIFNDVFGKKTPIIGGEGNGKKMLAIIISNDEYQKLKCFCEKENPPVHLTIVQDDALKRKKHIICEKRVYNIFKQNNHL